MNDAFVHYFKKNPRKLFPIIFSCGVILIVIIVTIVVLLPESAKTMDRLADIETKKKRDLSLSEKARFLTTVSPADLQKDYMTLETLVPSQTDVTAITQSVEGIARQNNAILASINLQSATMTKGSDVPAGAPTTLSMETVYSGQQQTMVKILESFYTSSPLFTIDNVKITNTSSGLSRLQVVAVSHFAMPPQTLGAADKPLKQLTAAQKLIIQGAAAYNHYEAIDLPIDGTASGSSIQRKNLFSQ